MRSDKELVGCSEASQSLRNEFVSSTQNCRFSGRKMPHRIPLCFPCSLGGEYCHYTAAPRLVTMAFYFLISSPGCFWWLWLSSPSSGAAVWTEMEPNPEPQPARLRPQWIIRGDTLGQVLLVGWPIAAYQSLYFSSHNCY